VFCISILENDNYEFPHKQELKKLPIDYIEQNADERYNLTEKNKAHYQREFGSKGKEINLYEPIPTLTSAMGTGGGNIPYFEFPPKQELKLKLKDMLENEVDEKFYLSNETMLKLQKYGYEQSLRLNHIENTCETINTMTGGHRQPKIEIPEATKKGYAEATDGDGVYINRPHQKRGCVQKQMIQTIKTSGGDLGVVDNLRIRKLTPKECFRLMGFDDTDFEKAAQVNSNSQLYKQAGHSIVVNVLEAIFKELFKNEEHIELIELFGGIGAPRKALQRIRQPHSVIDYVEIDKYAVKSYNAIYGENYEPKDICEYGKD
jgi:site-specific DNA-cytosine methylase